MSDLVEEKVKAIIAETFSVNLEDIIPTNTLSDDLGADSLDLIELTMFLEEAFDIEIADEEAEKVTTVAEAVNLVTEMTSSP